MVNRRQFITGVATASTVVIAGCNSGNNGSLTGDGPEDVVEQYVTAIQNGDMESVNEVLYPDSRQYPAEEDYFSQAEEFTLSQVEAVSPREFFEWQADQVGEEPTAEEVAEAVEDIEDELEDQSQELGVDDLGIVIITRIEEGETIEEPIPVVQQDGDWYVYPDL